VLPLGFWLAYYGGVASAGLLSRAASKNQLTAQIGQVALAVLAVWAAGDSFEVHLTQLGDARNEVQAYLEGLNEGTVVETYGLLVHLPHFDVSDASPYRLQRMSRRPIPTRNPLVGAEEIDAPLRRREDSPTGRIGRSGSHRASVHSTRGARGDGRIRRRGTRTSGHGRPRVLSIGVERFS